MKIGIVGAGKVGMSLGKYFASRNIPLSGYASRTLDRAREAAEFTGSTYYESAEALARESDILFLTVPDGQIKQAWCALPAEAVKGRIICHCSGALTAQETFPGIEEAGAFGYSVHPLFAFSDRYKCWEELSDVFFCIEGHPSHIDDVRALIEQCGNPLQIIAAEAKTRYHAAAAIASNHMVALVDESLRIMETCGFDREGALLALRPILLGNMQHVAHDGPELSLTGPIERCDVDTVRRHIEEMPTKEDRLLYLMMSHILVRVAQRKHPERSYDSMKALLESEQKND